MASQLNYRPDYDPGPLAIHEQLAAIWLSPQPPYRTTEFDLAERVLYRLDMLTVQGWFNCVGRQTQTIACTCEACSTWRALI